MPTPTTRKGNTGSIIIAFKGEMVFSDETGLDNVKAQERYNTRSGW